MNETWKIEKSVTLCLLGTFLAAALLPVSVFGGGAREYPEPGLLFFAHYPYRDNTDAIDNPYILGAFITVYWSTVEKRSGEYDWDEVDRRIEPWIKSGKKIAFRIMWASNGIWQDPAADRPTPEWVWKEGAKKAYSQSTDTEAPLQWDPVYKKYAFRFMQEFRKKYGDNPSVLFVDITPGGETNPYRAGISRKKDSDFDGVFAATRASDSRVYSDSLWAETVKEYLDYGVKLFSDCPVCPLVTLNVGRLPRSKTPAKTEEFGDYAADIGCLVGQNGLAEKSFTQSGANTRQSLFQRWSEKVPVFFEMVHPTDTPGTGSLEGVMRAGIQRGHCSYINVYAADVLKGTPGQSDYDPEYEAALRLGYELIQESPKYRK